MKTLLTTHGVAWQGEYSRGPMLLTAAVLRLEEEMALKEEGLELSQPESWAPIREKVDAGTPAVSRKEA